MVRYTLASAGTPAQGSLPLSVTPHVIDLFKGGEQISEHYLTELNPKGQVRPRLSATAIKPAYGNRSPFSPVQAI
jgi:hypothetical protein